MKHEKITLKEFLQTVGRKRFENGVGCRSQNLTRAVNVDKKMPASWFIDVRDWCVANKIDVPEHLFKWADHFGKSPTNQNDCLDNGFQGANSD